MKLSVIIPVYNVEKYLQDCIDSLMAQTYDDSEFIFVDDASTDSCLEILRRSEQRFPEKIRVIASEENRCQGGARNIGIREARGEYIGFVDSDDLTMPDMFMVMCKKAEETDVDAIFIKYTAIPDGFRYTDVADFDGKELICWNKRLLDCNEKYLSDEDRMNFIVYPLGGVYCGIWKKSLIIDHGIFFPEHIKYEDNYWITVIALYLNKVAFIDKIGYLYRSSPASTTHQNNAMHHFDRLTIERKLRLEIKRLNKYRTYRGGVDYIYIVRYVFNSYWIFLTRFENPPVEALKGLIRDLKREIPQYYKNTYYKEIVPVKRKLMDRAAYSLPPKSIVVIYRLLLKIRRIVKR